MKPESSGSSAIDWRRMLHRLLAVLGTALLIVLTVIAVLPDQKVPGLLHVDRLIRCDDPPVIAEFRRAGMAKALAAPFNNATERCRETSLPDVENAQSASLNVTTQQIGRVRYRLAYSVPENWPPGESLLVFAPRAMGTAWQVRVDNMPIADDLEDWRMTWNLPVVAKVESAHIAPGSKLDIEFRITFLADAGHSLAPVTIGPASLVAGEITLRDYLQVSLPQACSTALLLMGAFFLAFWASRPKEREHLLLALAALAWCVSNLQYVVPRHDDPTLEAVYSAIVNMSVCWFMWLVYLFVLRIDSRRLPWVESTLPIFVFVMSLLAIPFSGLLVDAGMGFQIANAVVASGVTGLIAARAIRGGSMELRAIAISLILALLAGAHDIGLLATLIPPQSIYLLPYSGILVFGALLFTIQQRYTKALDDHEALSANLTKRLNAREAELTANHERMLLLERHATLSAERQRLMHDMHDGVGSALLTTLAAVEQGKLGQEHVANNLRSCIDDLRLVIDSLEPMEHDLATLLATIRYRLGDQLSAAGLALDWVVGDIPQLPWLEASAALQVSRIVQEALANVVKHAGASVIRVKTVVRQGAIEVQIQDNGHGFDPNVVTYGRGIKSLHRRAKLLQGSLTIESKINVGTSLILCLPRHHQA